MRDGFYRAVLGIYWNYHPCDTAMNNVKYTDEYEVLTPDGFKSFRGIQKLTKWVYYLKTENHEMGCSYDHPFQINGNIVKYSELKVGDFVDTEDGLERVLELSPTNREEDVYDLLEVDGGHVFYSNGIISHNCQFIETGESAIAGSILDRWRKTRKPPIASLDGGHYLIWEPPKVGHIYSIGVDVSEGVGEAASVAQILDLTDLTNIRQVACYHDKMIDPHFFAEKLYRIANQWGRPYLAIERNNCGGQVIDGLFHTFGYNKFINYTTTGGNKDKFGIYSSSNTKYTGVSNMRYWINTLDVLEINDINLIQEFETFIRRPNGIWKKKDGRNIFDDRVDSLFWALLCLETEICQEYFNIEKYDDRGRPSKIANVHFEAPQYYQLDNMYQFNPSAPMPFLFGIEPNDPNNPSVSELIEGGWNFV